MKSLLFLLAAGTLSLSAASIVGTKHDLSSTGGGAKSNTTQVCVFCHAPHNTAAVQIIPLWNHATTASTFTLYTSSTMTATGVTETQPAGASLACMSCHDGTLATGNVLNKPADALTGITFTATTTVDATGKIISGANLLGTDLSNDHPVSVTYPASPATYGFTTTQTATKLFSNKVECASCHQVHDNTIAPFLRMSMTNSALCLDCHVK